MADVTETAPAQNGGASMTIDELAQRTGMTVRNIRAHQSRGLVPPPEVRGRTGYYGDDHVARVELIQELQADGFNLESIRKLLDTAGGSSAEVLNFSRTLRAPFEDEQPEILTEEEFAERWGGRSTTALMARTEKLGLLRDLGDGRYEILSPRLQRAGLELAELGVPPGVALDVVSQVRTQRAAGRARVHRTLPGERLEAVQRGGPAGGGLAEGARRPRAAAAAGVRGAARDLPAGDERDGRGGHRPRDPAWARRRERVPRAPGSSPERPPPEASVTDRLGDERRRHGGRDERRGQGHLAAPGRFRPALAGKP